MAAAGKLRHAFGSGHIVRTDPIGELDTVAENHFLSFAIGEIQDGFKDGSVFLGIAAVRPGPASDSSKEMQPLRGDTHFHFNMLRQSLGESLAAFQNHRISGGPLRTDDIKRDIADFNNAMPGERGSVFSAFKTHINAFAGIHGKRRSKIENTEALLVGAEEGNQVPQSVCAQCFESLRH